MLPLDSLTDAASAALREKGIEPEQMSAAVRLDLDFDGRYGESWLVLDREAKTVHRLLADTDSIPQSNRKVKGPSGLLTVQRPDAETVRYRDALPLDLYTDLTVDTCLSSNRLLALRHDGPCPDCPDGEQDEEKNAVREEWDRRAVTEIAAYCTNSCRPKLSAFCRVADLLLQDREIDEEDPLFSPFHPKCPKCGQPYPDPNIKVCPNCRKQGATLKRLFAFLLPYKFYALVVLLCMLGTSAVSLITPVLSGKVLYDYVIDPGGKWHSPGMLFLILSSIVAVALAGLGIEILRNRVNVRLSHRMITGIKQKTFASMMRLSLSYFNKLSIGQLIQRINTDTERLQSFYINTLPDVVVNGVTFIGLTVLLFFINFKLTLIVFIPVPMIVLIFKKLLPKYRRSWGRKHKVSSAAVSMLSDTLSGIRVVKAFAKETDETHRFLKLSERLFSTNMNVTRISIMIFPVVSILMGLSSQAIWGYGGLQVMGRAMTYGEFVTYFGYIGLIFGPLKVFTTFFDTLMATLDAGGRILEVHDAVPEITEDPDAVEMETLKGDIRFNNVSFHYTPGRPVLKDVDLTIHAGESVGIVGHTGSGKSTIVNLITRMYDPVSGQITVDGIDLKKIRLSSLRRSIAIVSQEIFLFRGTIADNIRYARPDATMEEVIEAAKAASAHDFIMQLPNGYETDIGSGRRALSGGEKQRISIARALLLKPSILILDEATAAMDTDTERQISNAIAGLVKGRTCITIAHRLSTLKDCTHLFVIENGEVVEEGEPEALLAQGGVFHKLYTLQYEAMKKVLAGD